MSEARYDLSDRLESFAANIIMLYDKRPESYSGDYLAKQLIRSSCSSALNYGEVLGAGTSKDKINKLRICLKELRECERNLNIQSKAGLFPKTNLSELKNEIDQLIRIVVTMLKNSK
ncbi:four helix bundle protein [Flavobacteriaceae bacterium MAR_2010_188]|nr:four helix bundle protein [Flavobacteriaceae bacterium MAR_2010_188]